LALFDVGAGEPFVASIVPLAEVRRGDGEISVAGDFTSLHRASERAHQDAGKVEFGQSRLEGARLLFADGGKCDVGAAGVLAGTAPFRFTVADQPDFLFWHAVSRLV